MSKHITSLFKPNHPFTLFQDEGFFRFLRPESNGVMQSYSPSSEEILEHIDVFGCVIRNSDGWFIAGMCGDLADFNLDEISTNDIERYVTTANGILIETKRGAVLVAHKWWKLENLLFKLGIESDERWYESKA